MRNKEEKFREEKENRGANKNKNNIYGWLSVAVAAAFAGASEKFFVFYLCLIFIARHTMWPWAQHRLTIGCSRHNSISTVNLGVLFVKTQRNDEKFSGKFRFKCM